MIHEGTPHVAVAAGSNLNGCWTITEVMVTMSPRGIGFPSHLALGHAPSVPSSPVGAGAMDIEGLPVDGCGDSRPVVDSIGGLELLSDVDEPDAEEPESLGCTQAANSRTRTTAAMLSRMACDGFIAPPYGWVSRSGERCLREASGQRLARWNDRWISMRRPRAAEAAVPAIYPLYHRAAPPRSSPSDLGTIYPLREATRPLLIRSCGRLSQLRLKGSQKRSLFASKGTSASRITKWLYAWNNPLCPRN